MRNRTLRASAVRLRRVQSSRWAERAFSLVELLVVITIIALLVGILLPALGKAKEEALKARCKANLHNIGIALTQYANENDGKLPSLPHKTDYTWNRIGKSKTIITDDSGVANYSNTRAFFFHLVRGGKATAGVFVCPSTTDIEVPDTTVDDVFDFPNAKYVSYSFQNQWVYNTKLTDSEGFPVCADRNPQLKWPDKGGNNGDTGQVNDQIPKRNYTKVDVKESANSENHSGIGQNVLFIGGDVRFCNTPLVGLTLSDGIVDNIYTKHDASEYGAPLTDDAQFKEGPSERQDCWLVP